MNQYPPNNNNNNPNVYSVSGAAGGYTNPAMTFTNPIPPPAAPSHYVGPPSVGNVPPGLEYLTRIDQLLIKQQIELAEIMLGFETNNRYKVLNNMGQQVFYAKENTDCCTRMWCGPKRPFTINIFDNQNVEILRLIRPYSCSCIGPCFSCCNCCLEELEVQAPVGVPIGYILQKQNGCQIEFLVQDANRNTVLCIHGLNCCALKCRCFDVPFKLMTADGNSSIGEITKEWSGLLKEMFTDADNFGVRFPMDLDVKIKAVVLGAVFLIDFMFFEEPPNNDNNRRF